MKKLLHADDVKRFRDLVQGEFEADFQVISLEDGDRVLAETSAQNPDIVILDHLMPSGSDEDGLDICRTLRAQHPALPIVIFSGAWDGTPDQGDAVEKAGATFVAKTDGREAVSALRATVDNLLAASDGN